MMMRFIGEELKKEGRKEEKTWRKHAKEIGS
jgi:hypothetical protein